MTSAGQDGIALAPPSSKSESIGDDEFTNMAAVAVSWGSNGSTTSNTPSAMHGNGPQRSFSLSQQPGFTNSAKQQQPTVFYGQPPHMPAHMQQQSHNAQQPQQAHQHYTTVATDNATSPASTGPPSGNASNAGPHPPPASSSGGSSSFPTSTALHRAVGSTSTSGNTGGLSNGSYSSNEHSIMPNGSNSLSSDQGPVSAEATSFQPLQANVHSTQHLNVSKGTGLQHTQPAYLSRGSSPLSYALQSFPSTSSAPLASTSTAIPIAAKSGMQSSVPQQHSSQPPSFDPAFTEKVELFSSVSVSDHRHLFHAYIYDYLYRQGYERTARAFLQDAPNVPTKQSKDRKGKQKATTTATASNSVEASSSRNSNKRKRSENEENDTILGDKVENTGNEPAESTIRPKKRPTSQTSLSNMPDSILEEEDEADDIDGTSSGSRHTTSNQEGKPSTSSSEDSNSTGSSALFFGSSTKDSSSNASLSTQATTATNTSIQTGLESHTATKGSDADTVTSAGDEHDQDATINTMNSPFGSRDTQFSPTLFSPNQSPDKSDLSIKDIVEMEEIEGEEDLPLPDIQIDSNWGFLYEWWEVFWDVWRAKGAKGAGSLAAKAYERTLHEFPQPTVNGVPIASIQPRVGGLPIYTGQQDQLVPQQQHASQPQASSQHQQASHMSHSSSQSQHSAGVAAPKLQPTAIPSRQNSIALTSSVASNISQLPEENLSPQPPQSSNARIAQPPPLKRMESDSVVQMQSTSAAAAEESRKQQDRNSEPTTFVSPPTRAGHQNQPALRAAPTQMQGPPHQQQQRNAPPPQIQPQNRPASVAAQSPAVPPAPQLPNESVQQPRMPEHQLGSTAHLGPASVPYQQHQQEGPLHMQPNQQGQPMLLQAHMQHQQQQQGHPQFQGQPMQQQAQHPQAAPHVGQAHVQQQQQMMQQSMAPTIPGIPRQVSVAVASAPQQLAGPVAGRRLAVSGPPPGYAGAPGQAPYVPPTQMQARPGMPQGAMPGPHVAIQAGQPVRILGQPHPSQQHVAIQPSHPGAMVAQTTHMHPHMQHQHVQGQMNPVYVQGSPPGQVIYQGHPAQPGQQRVVSHPQMQPQMAQQHQGMPMYAQQAPGRPLLVQGGPGQPLQQMQAQPQLVQQGPPAGLQQRPRPPSVAGHQMQMQGADVEMSSPAPGPMRAPSRSSGSPFLQYANPTVNGAPSQFPGKPQPIDLQAHASHFAHPGQASQSVSHQALQVDHEALRRQGMVSPAPGRDNGTMQFHQQQQQQQARMQEMQRQANGQLLPGQQAGMPQQVPPHPGMQQQGQPMSQQHMQHYKASMHTNHMQQARQVSQVNGQSPHETAYSPQTAPTPSNLQIQQGIPQPPSSPFPGQQQVPQAAAQQVPQNTHHQQQIQQQQQQHAMQQHHHQQQLQQHQHQQQLHQRQQAQHAQAQQQHQLQQQTHQQQSQLQPDGQHQQQQVFRSPVPGNVHQQQSVTNSPQPLDFAYSGNGQPIQQQQQSMPEEYSTSPQMTQQQQHAQQQMQDANGGQQQGHDQQGRQLPVRQFSQQQSETGPMPPPQIPSGRRGAMAPAINGQHLPRAPTPASAAATPTANGMLHGSPDPQHQPPTPHTPRTPNAQVLSSSASAPGSGNSSKAAPPPPVAVKNRKRTNTDTSAKTKKPRVSKAKDTKAQEAQVVNKSTPQSQATPLPSVDDAALYKAPMQQQNGQQNGMHHQQGPTAQQQQQQQQQMQIQGQHQQQQQAHNSAMQQSGIIDVPQFSPNLDFSFGDLGDFTQFGIENMSTSLNTNPLMGDDGSINFDDFLVSGWQSTA